MYYIWWLIDPNLMHLRLSFHNSIAGAISNSVDNGCKIEYIVFQDNWSLSPFQKKK